jgi:hypothetical protein
MAEERPVQIQAGPRTYLTRVFGVSAALLQSISTRNGSHPIDLPKVLDNGPDLKLRAPLK